MIFSPKYVICAKMRTIFVVFLWIFVAKLPTIRGADNCQFAAQRVTIDDTYIGIQIYNVSVPSSATFVSFYVQNTGEAVDTTIAKTYFDVNITDDSFLTLSTTEAFQNLGKDAETGGSSLLVVVLYATINCDGESADVPLIIAVTDTYRNHPIFNKDSYIYSVPMPIMQKTDVTLYGEEIKISDINFSNTGMTFTISPDDFQVTASQTDNKHFTAVFRAKRILQFTENQTYILTATNSGNKSSQVTLTIAVNSSEGLDSPSFAKSYYSFEYSYENPASLIPKDGDIVITSDKSEGAQYKIDGEMASYFLITFDNDTKKFVLATDSDNPLPTNVSSQIVLTLSYATDATANAILLINIVDADVVPTFSSNYYTGTYSIETNEITWSQGVNVTDAVEVELTGDKSPLFTIDNSTYDITPVSPLSKVDFGENLNILFTVIAKSSSEKEARAVIVISLETVELDELQFDSVYYGATYSEANSSGIVTLDNDIGFSGLTNFTGIEINVDDAYSENFKIDLDSSTWKISVSAPLNETTLKNNSELAIVLTATKTGVSGLATAILIMKLPEKVDIKFGNSYYSGSYLQGTDTDSVELDQDITVTGAEPGDLSIVVEGFADNFMLTYNDSTSSYEIMVKEKLNSTILNSNSILVLSIIATLADVTTSSVLILDLPEQTLELKFGKQHYVGTYTVGDEVVLEEGGIQIQKSEDLSVQFSVEGFDGNFQLVYNNATSSYVINVTSPLNPSVLEANTKLVLTITAFVADTELADYAVLVLDLAQKTSLLSFEKTHYTAIYVEYSESSASINVTDGPIKLYNEDNLKLKFSYEDYDDNFQLVYDNVTSSYVINVSSPLNASILEMHTKLVLTITVVAIDAGLADYAVLVLELPRKTSLLSFDKNHYSAIYVVDSETRPSINITDGPIKLYNEDNLSLQFSYEDFDENFELIYDSATLSYIINVTSPLNSSILETHTKLVLTITAFATNAELVDYAVLVIDLPQESSMLSFEKTHYSAIYTEDTTSGASVKVTDGPIKLYNEDNLNLQFSYEGFDDNFQLSYDKASGTYGLSVVKPLNDSLINSNTQLIITIVASTTDGSWTTNTIMVIKLPTDNEKTLAFDKEYYTASYQTDPEPFVKLNDAIVLNTKGYANIDVALTGYKENFDLEYDSENENYSIKVKNPLNDTVLSLNSQLLIVITAIDSASDAITSSVLVLDLPSYTIAAFDNDYYAAEYLLSNDTDTDVILVIDKRITVKSAEYAQIVFLGYEDNFKGTCDVATLECTISVKNNLNASILSANNELLVTLITSSDGQSSIGKSVLLLKLPAKTSTFTFSKQHYRAVYSIQKSDSQTAAVALTEDISLEGINSTDVVIALDEYSPFFEIVWDTSAWKLNVLKNLEAAILSNKSDLAISLTASKTGQSDPDYAKAVLLVKLPDDATVAFDKSQYFGEYVISDSDKPKVVLDSDSDINISDSDNSIIILDSFTENFDITLDNDSKWNVISTNPLNSSILSKYSELKLLITITKIGVRYGKAGLTIKLPSFSFSKKVYTGIYSVDDDEVGHINVSDIMMENVDPFYIQVNLTTYNEYLYTEWSDNKWTVKVAKPLPASTADKLITNLIALRTTDNKSLATSTLVISLVTSNSTNIPKFSTFTFYGVYETSDPPIIKLRELISFADDNTATVSNIYIDASSEYASNFSLQREDNDTYSISVEDPLSQDVLDEVTSIVFTLISISEDGTKGYATLAIALPKALRNVSVQLENQEILYNGTYENGVFSAPDIHLVTNSTNDDDISVNITNELGIDGKYFTYNYTHKILYVEVSDLPDDIVNGTSVIPLKLTITDRTTQDTAYAVLNVQISGSSDDGGGGESKGLIAATAILAILLILLIIAVFLFWCLKLRKNRYVEMTNEEINKTTKTTTFTKNETKKPAGLSSNSFRRPTGLPVIETSNTLEESSNDHVIPGTPYPTDFEKKVAFNDAIEKIEEKDDENVGEPERLQSVANRRPTEFVFGYPLEKGVFDIPDERRESSDYNDNVDADKKKSVAFDDNVERMPIDSGEDPENESDDDNNGSIFRTEIELQIKEEEQLPSQIFKAIF